MRKGLAKGRRRVKWVISISELKASKRERKPEREGDTHTHIHTRQRRSMNGVIRTKK